MKNLLTAVGAMLILGGTLGFRSVSDTRPLSGKATQQVSIEGVIQEVAAVRPAVNVSGTWVYLPTRTIIQSNTGIVLRMEHLGVGLKVRAFGTMNPDGSMNASRMEFPAK